MLPFDGGDAALLRRHVAELWTQGGPALEVLVVDAAGTGPLRVRGATVVRQSQPGRGLAWRRALEATEAPWIAWGALEARDHPERLTRQLAAARAHPGTRIVTCAIGGGSDPQPPALGPGADGLRLAGGWEAGVLVRREALASVRTEAFAPVELELLRNLRADSPRAHLHLAQPLVDLPPAARARGAERLHTDRLLLELARRPASGPPALTVLLATHERRAILLECLEGFARQLVPPGTFELVVIDDGSRDGTLELLRGLRLDVPLRVLAVRAGGASRARTVGLPHARGRTILFVNDDTIPFPDTVAGHLAAHDELRGRRAMVLGTFEQPAEHAELALTRLLERSHYVFGYADWEADQELPGQAFYTCNLSVPREALDATEGFDPSFAMYAEDTDLGLRLEEQGWRIRYRPEIRSIHRHLLDFEHLRWRQRAVAKAHVRLFAKHPRLCAGSAWAGLTRFALERQQAAVEPFLSEIEAAARTLADLRLAALEALDCRDTAQQVEERLAELIAKLNQHWWTQGFLDGLEELGLAGFPDLFARWTPPPAAFAGEHALLCPRADDPHGWLARLAAWLAAQGTPANQSRDGRALLLVADREQGLAREAIERLAGPVVGRARRMGRGAPVAIVERRDLDADELREHALGAPEEPRSPLALCTLAATRVLAWPSWDEARSLEQLGRCMAALPQAGELAFVLCVEPQRAAAGRRGLLALERALAALAAPRALPEVVLLEAPLEPEAWIELGHAVEATLLLSADDPGSTSRAGVLARLPVPRLRRPQELVAFASAMRSLATTTLPLFEREEALGV